MKLLRLVGEAPDLIYEPAGRNRDGPRREVEPVLVVENPEREQGLFVVQKRLAHTHNDHVGDALRGDIAGGDEDLFGDFTGLEVAFDTEKARSAKSTAHRAANLGRDADRPPASLGDHDRLYEMAVARLEEVLACPIGCSGDAGELEDGGRGLCRERSPQTLREGGGLLPVPHPAATEGAIGLFTSVGRLAPVL